MTTKDIKNEIEHFKRLPYSIQYRCFEYFLKKNIKQSNYFIELIKSYERKNENVDN